MPPWGRPPEGSLGMGKQRRGVWGPDGAHYGSKLRELGDSEDEHLLVRMGKREGGVLLDPSLMKQRGRGINDDLYYRERLDPRSYMEEQLSQEDLAYGDAYALRDDFYDRTGAALPPGPALEEQEILLQRALGRIRRARIDGQPDVSLSHEELDALAGGRHFSPYSATPAQAPPSPVGRPSSKGRSRTNATSSAGSSTRTKRSSSHTQASRSGFFSSSPQPSKRSSKSNKRSTAYDHTVNPPSGPPAFMVPGYGPAPLGYSSRSSPSQPTSRSGSLGSQTRGHGQGNRAASPFDTVYPYGGSLRPPSSSSRTSYSSAPDDAEFPRSRSGSAVYQSSQAQRMQQQQSFPSYPDLDPFVYQTAGPEPGAPHVSAGGRRLASGSETEHVSYASVPRRLSAMPSAVSGGRPASGLSEPAVGYRIRYGYEDDRLHESPSGSSGEDGTGNGQQGVQVGVVPEGVREEARAEEARPSNRAVGSSGAGNRNRRGKWKRK
ncbi:hypothetical protein K490DRAFT_62098 [Saccharata proteae CBS 121410]|uniref:Uncharacterized protein n=1 Tax=Saccharata proteae CBS 121410 TaxID=1314787 RepID=A0A9P4HZJ0_9PEZI|nr:hypothetical protein K490DRAFT_62098 [Saccharata proteae CBS 121410]